MGGGGHERGLWLVHQHGLAGSQQGDGGGWAWRGEEARGRGAQHVLLPKLPQPLAACLHVVHWQGGTLAPALSFTLHNCFCSMNLIWKREIELN